MVEDSLPGIHAGIAAGMNVYAFQPHGVDPDIPAGVITVRRLGDLKSLLAGGTATESGDA